ASVHTPNELDHHCLRGHTPGALRLPGLRLWPTPSRVAGGAGRRPCKAGGARAVTQARVSKIGATLVRRGRATDPPPNPTRALRGRGPVVRKRTPSPRRGRKQSARVHA